MKLREEAPVNARRLHLALTLVWALLAVPVVLWWRDSILVVLLISVYANVVGHWSAYQAARAERPQGDSPDGPA